MSADVAVKNRYRGRIAQIFIYLGKLVRMFLYQNDWKMLPMAAVIAAIVTYAVGGNLYQTQEGTASGSFALICVCIWNGFFNSIQVVCRERDIIKREHRAGLHISSYIAAHMIYQFVLCALQSIISIGVCQAANVKFPATGLVTPSFRLDLGITLFLVTYSADMISLAVSCLVRTTTTAMTVMPFLLIIQMIFSGGFAGLAESAEPLTRFTIARWGLTALCSLGNYNSLPMVTLWNTLYKFRDVELEGFGGVKPVELAMNRIMDEGGMEEFLQRSGEYNQNPLYVYSADNVIKCWIILLFFALLFAFLAAALLKRVDHDKR